MIRDPGAFDAFLHSLRRFVRERLIPQEAEVAARDEVPPALVDAMAAQGLFGYSIPEAYGGAGMSTEELVLAAIELSQCSVAFRARVGTNTGIGRRRWWPTARRSRSSATCRAWPAAS